jgi:hypothetical protein
MGIALAGAAGIVGYVAYNYFEVAEEFGRQTPQEFFMQEYRAIRNARLLKEATK